MKVMLRNVENDGIHYDCLMFICPGCSLDGSSGLHMLPVNTPHAVSWTWDGNLEAPTLAPSIATRTGNEAQKVCHSFLIEGVFIFLDDCTHALAGKQTPLPDLPVWITKEIE